MGALDYGDPLDLLARLETLRSDGSRRLVVVVGSGLSNQVLPDVSEMTQLFKDAAPSMARSRFAAVDAVFGTPLGYQNAASILKHQVGDRGMARVVRRAVLNACTSVPTPDVDDVADSEDKCRALEQKGEWTIPAACKDLALFLAGLPGDLRGPVITTNFDPMIELALRDSQVPATPVPVTFDQVPSSDQLREYPSLPVLHIHGYWTSRAALSTIPQLTKDRPGLVALLRELMRNSIILIIGYGGWEDAFMRTLAARVDEFDLLGSEILWAAFGKDPALVLNNETLRRLDGLPGFNLYLGVDAAKLFHVAFDEAPATAKPAPFGFTRLPAQSTSNMDARSFLDGHQPTWEDAAVGSWPVLDSTTRLKDAVLERLGHGGGGGAIAVGPMGEGKSLGLRQVASQLAEELDDWTVLWREAGAPRITTAWLDEAMGLHPQVLLCSDDADLIGSELLDLGADWRKPGSGFAVLLATQDRLWRPYAKKLGTDVKRVVFQGLEESDAHAIAASWVRHDLVPDMPEGGVEALATDLVRSSRLVVDGQPTTLFGSVLEVRHDGTLASRVEDLVEKLSAISILPDSAVSLGDVFGGICLIQTALDLNGDKQLGASRSLIASMVDLPGVFADGKILDLLGREAAVAYAGNRVYSRHPAIARSVVEYLRRLGRAEKAAELVGYAGGRLRSQGGVDVNDYRAAYLIGRDLKDPLEAFAAAKGAVLGASDMLEPRVTLLSVMRRNEDEGAGAYGRGLAQHVRAFKDGSSATRAFLTEYSHVARRDGEAYFGLGLAGLALHDGVGFMLDRSRASYALTALALAARSVSVQSHGSVAGAVASARVILEAIEGPDIAEKHIPSARIAPKDRDVIRDLSIDSVINRLGQQLCQPAGAAKEQSGLDLDFRGQLSLQDLRRLVAIHP